MRPRKETGFKLEEGSWFDSVAGGERMVPEVLLFLGLKYSKTETGLLTVSLRKKKATSQAVTPKVAATAQGRKYGYSERNLLPPNTLGNRSVGRDREPPIMGPSYRIQSSAKLNAFLTATDRHARRPCDWCICI
jgi:hypothetical protein